jgi:hypothetical protein
MPSGNDGVQRKTIQTIVKSKENIHFFCTLKIVGNTFQPKQNKIQIPKQ